ncbi:MAG TPA: class I SAM-dependent methyltransferase [Nitrospira sp.]|nr:class I SAM-dependent methyltransferase [Nitrospira sp.]
MTPSSFDEYAENYDETLAEGLAVSGEDSSYFARGRVLWLRYCLQQLGEKPRAILDYGCGTGSTAPLFHELLGVETVVGLDASAQLIERAHQKYGTERSRFLMIEHYQPSAQVDLAYCNGVFHHIPVSKRDQVVAYIARTLRPGGLFALWENNPWNPGTRYIMRRIPFDRDAVTLTATETQRLLSTCGFEIVGTNFLFVFPRLFGWLRWIEPFMSGLPLGAQYLVLGRKLS